MFNIYMLLLALKKFRMIKFTLPQFPTTWWKNHSQQELGFSPTGGEEGGIFLTS